VIAFLEAFFVTVLYAAVFGKATNFGSWVDSVRAIVSPRARSRVIEIGLPTSEFVIASSVFLDRKVGVVLMAMLFALLAAGSCALDKRFRGAECGCFGSLSATTLGPALCRRNIVLAALSCVLAFGALGAWFVPSVSEPSRLLFYAFGSLTAVGGFVALPRARSLFASQLDGRRPSISLPNDVRGRAWLALFVSSGCASCQRLLKAGIPASANGLPVLLVPIEADRSESEGVFRRHGGLLPRWELADLAQVWRVPAVPFGVAVSSDGRVVAQAHVANLADLVPLSNRRRAADPNPAASRLTRRALVEKVVGVSVTSWFALPLYLALTRARVAVAASFEEGDPSFTDFDENRVTGTCAKLNRHVDSPGVKIAPNRAVPSFGYTEGPKNKTVVIRSSSFFDLERKWKGYCGCDPKKTLYDNESLCKLNGYCRDQLHCLAPDCTTVSEQYCLSVKFILGVEVSGWTISHLTWVPSDKKCEKKASIINNFGRDHEKRHVGADRKAAEDAQEPFKKRICASTEEKAKQQLEAFMKQALAQRTQAILKTYADNERANANELDGKEQYKDDWCEEKNCAELALD